MTQFFPLLFLGLCSVVSASEPPKNIIMVVGDGMGPAYTTAYRLFADDPATSKVENTVFDRLLVGMASTYPDTNTGYITDSAASATALSTGVKTYNGAIGVDVNKKSVLTVLELAKQQGRKTGIAVTSQINHATPAGFSSHNESRQNYNEIADSYFDKKIKGKFVLDVMLGGGWKYFIREDRNIVEQFKNAGYQYIDNYDQLDMVKPRMPLLGLFAEVGLPWALDSENNRRLGALAKTAVSSLENDKGFFLLVEGSQVDWAGHANDVAAAMAEMHDLALTLEWLEEYVKTSKDTLLVVTADHSTGGLTVGANRIYNWDPAPLKSLKASPEVISKQLVTEKNKADLASKLLGLDLTAEEQKQLTELDSDNARVFHGVLTRILDERSVTGWTTGGHTGVDVPIMAIGPGSEHFHGHLDNTQIAESIFELLKARNK